MQHPLELYPTGSVRALLDTDQVSPATRKALQRRLNEPAVHTPKFLTPPQFATLQLVAFRLIPQIEVDMAGPLDARLADNEGDGWRFSALPPDREAHRCVLQLLSEAQFCSLSAAEQDGLLTDLQHGRLTGPAWLRGPEYFQELLAELSEIYFSHPLAQERIGYVGMADTPGWERIGLNQREEREPGERGE